MSTAAQQRIPVNKQIQRLAWFQIESSSQDSNQMVGFVHLRYQKPADQITLPFFLKGKLLLSIQLKPFRFRVLFNNNWDMIRMALH